MLHEFLHSGPECHVSLRVTVSTVHQRVPSVSQVCTESRDREAGHARAFFEGVVGRRLGVVCFPEAYGLYGQ